MGTKDLFHVMGKPIPEGWVVFALMGVFFLVFLYKFIGALGALNREKSRLKELQDVLNGYDPEMGDVLSWEDVETALPQTQGLVAEAAHMVYRLSAQPHLLQAAVAALVRRDFLPRYLRGYPNLFMLLGLLGTVAGLARTLQGLAPQVQQAASATGPEQLAQQLGITLGAMQDAFGASLLGILLAAFASLALGFWNRRQGQFSEDLERTLLLGLAPALMPRSVEAALQAQIRALRSSAQVAKDFQQAFSEAASRFEALMGRTAEALGQNLDRLAELAGQVQGSLETSTRTLDQSSQALADAGSRLAVAQDLFSKQFDTATQNLTQQLGGHLRRLEDLQAALQQGFKESLEGTFQVSHRLDATVRVFREEGQRLYTRFGEAYALLDQRLERLERLLAPLAKGGS